MSAFRLSPLRSKGWVRLGIAAALSMPAITGMEYALGYFSDGAAGVEQALEFLASGVVLALIMGFSAGWVVQGFAVRLREEGEDHQAAHQGPGLAAPPRTARPLPHH